MSQFEDKLILLVEDNPDDQELTLLALKKNNIHAKVVIAADGVQALDLLHGQNNVQQISPDLVLLDLKLPKLNGLDVLKSVRTNLDTKHIPVVMLTTSTEDADVASSYDYGANSYIRKPVNYNDFVEKISYIVKYWFVCNRSFVDKKQSV